MPTTTARTTTKGGRPARSHAIAQEDRAALAAAIAALAAAVREAEQTPGLIFGFLARMARGYAYDNCLDRESQQDADPRDERLAEAFEGVWNVVDGQFGWLSDAEGREYDSRRRDPAVVRLVERCILGHEELERARARRSAS